MHILVGAHIHVDFLTDLRKVYSSFDGLMFYLFIFFNSVIDDDKILLGKLFM